MIEVLSFVTDTVLLYCRAVLYDRAGLSRNGVNTAAVRQSSI